MPEPVVLPGPVRGPGNRDLVPIQEAAMKRFTDLIHSSECDDASVLADGWYIAEHDGAGMTTDDLRGPFATFADADRAMRYGDKAAA